MEIKKFIELKTNEISKLFGGQIDNNIFQNSKEFIPSDNLWAIIHRDR